MRNTSRSKLSLALPASVFLFFALLESVDTIGFAPTLAFDAESLALTATDAPRPNICRLRQDDDGEA